MRPVVVAGAGPVGQTAALLLARWNVPVILLDKREQRDAAGSKAICQQRDILDIWESVGAGKQIAERGVTWRHAHTFHRDRELSCVDYADASASPFPPWVNISQSETERILDERIAANPRVRLRWNSEVVDMHQDDDGVDVVLHNGSEIRTPYLLACAGSGGDVVRRALGVDFAGRSFGDRFLICDIRADLGSWAHERRFYFDPDWNPGRQVLIHACPDSTYRIDWQVPPAYDPAGDDLGARIRRIIGHRTYDVVWRSVYRFHSRLVDRMRVGRVLLVGDCAHLVAPFGARGLNSGVADAENAAWKIAYVLHGWAPPSLLDTYDLERHAAARENLDVTSATMRFLAPQTPAERAWRETVLCRCRSDPSAIADIDSGRMAEPFWYADSPLTTPDPTRPRPRRMPRGSLPVPAPGVLVPDVPVTVGGRPGRLRHHVRSGLLALTNGADRRAVEA
ncbi:MAG: FAD-dependent monooxygenase, partial [Solirubrobacteraceae bacterium]